MSLFKGTELISSRQKMPPKTSRLIISGVSFYTREHDQHRGILVPDKPSRMISRVISVMYSAQLVLYNLDLCLNQGQDRNRKDVDSLPCRGFCFPRFSGLH